MAHRVFKGCGSNFGVNNFQILKVANETFTSQ